MKFEIHIHLLIFSLYRKRLKNYACSVSHNSSNTDRIDITVFAVPFAVIKNRFSMESFPRLIIDRSFGGKFKIINDLITSVVKKRIGTSFALYDVISSILIGSWTEPSSSQWNFLSKFKATFDTLDAQNFGFLLKETILFTFIMLLTNNGVFHVVHVS